MFLKSSVILFFAIIAFTNSTDSDTEIVQQEPKNPTKNAAASVDSRFFDLGSIFNQMFPGFNQGNQGGFPGNPWGYPGNSYPGLPQSQNPTPQGNGWPIIDDAKQYPNQGNYQTQYPNQGNAGGSQVVQYPNQGNYGFPQQMQYSGQGGGAQQNQYPNQGTYGGSQQNGYPNPGNTGGNQVAQYPNPGNVGGSQPIQYPNQGNFGGSQQMQYPNQGNNVSQYPNQGGFSNHGNQNGSGTGSEESEDGTLYGILSTQKPPFTGSQNGQVQRPDQNQQPGNGPSAILGNPVVIPTTTAPPGQIIFPKNRTEDSPSQRQCVQDCSTTSEYNPVCGSNSVTYFNPGRFICARNCGINVFVARAGKCDVNSPL